METSRQRAFAFSDGDEQVGAERGPDLHAYSVRIGAEESAQAQVLFDPTKEQLDLPAVFVDRGDGQRVEFEVIGEENQSQTGLWIDKTDTSQGLRVTAPAFGGVEPDALVAPQSAARSDGPRLDHVIAGVGLEPGDKKGTGEVQAMQAQKIQIT